MAKFPVYFIAKASNAGDINGSKNIVWVLDLSPSDIDLSYHLLNQQPVAVNFCLLLSVEMVLSEKYIGDILAFLFYPRYKKTGNAPEVFWKPASLNLIQEAQQQVEKAITQQGFDSPSHHLLSPGSLVINTSGANFERIASVYYEALMQNMHPCCFDVKDNIDVLSLANVLTEVEIRFQKEQPVIFQLKSQNQQMKNELYATTRMLNAANQELAACQLHMNILRSGTEAKLLQDFYVNEYEVLPLWYKRFGHIVKVLTGKRTFKSLFSDKVKKYKA